MSHHYDVVCVGHSPGLLAAAALLARRTFRVLVVGEGHKRSHYDYEGIALARQRRAPVGLDTPVFAKMRLELAEAATWRRRSELLDPMFRLQWSAREGLSVPPSLERFLTELEKIAPAERAAAAAFYPELAEYNALFDSVLEAPEQVLGGGWLQRRKRDKLLRELGALHARVRGGPRAPIDDAMQALVQKGAQAEHLPPLAVARLYGTWTRGVTRLSGHDDALNDLLLDKVRASGGAIATDAQVLSYETKGKRVVAVALDDARAPVRCSFVLTTASVRGVLRKAGKFVPDARELAQLAMPRISKQRMHVSLAVPEKALPSWLAEETLIGQPGGLAVSLHVQRRANAEVPALLVARADLTAAEVPEGRERIVRALGEVLPKLERAALVIDSVHDGAPLWDQRSGKRQPIAREQLRDRGASSSEPEPIYELTGADPFAGERIERLLPNVRIVGPTALPALGLEGELAAALHAAQVITKSDRVRERMRRELWSKLEVEA